MYNIYSYSRAVIDWPRMQHDRINPDRPDELHTCPAVHRFWCQYREIIRSLKIADDGIKSRRLLVIHHINVSWVAASLLLYDASRRKHRGHPQIASYSIHSPTFCPPWYCRRASQRVTIAFIWPMLRWSILSSSRLHRISHIRYSENARKLERMDIKWCSRKWWFCWVIWCVGCKNLITSYYIYWW